MIFCMNHSVTSILAPWPTLATVLYSTGMVSLSILPARPNVDASILGFGIAGGLVAMYLWRSIYVGVDFVPSVRREHGHS